MRRGVVLSQGGHIRKRECDADWYRHLTQPLRTVTPMRYSDICVPSNLYERVVQIRSGQKVGAGFVINYLGGRFLVTARHLLPDSDDGSVDVLVSFRVHHHELGRCFARTRLALIPVEPTTVDLAVAPIGPGYAADLPVDLGTEGMVFSQSAWILGYPLGRAMIAPRTHMPLVKRGIIAGQSSVNGHDYLLVDVWNNPGFSGGPVCGPLLGTDRWSIFGVVNAYLHDPVDVVSNDPGQVAVDLGYSALANSGLTLATDLRVAKEAIYAASTTWTPLSDDSVGEIVAFNVQGREIHVAQGVADLADKFNRSTS